MFRLYFGIAFLLLSAASTKAIDLKLPWPSGESWVVTVGYNGYCEFEGCPDEYHTDAYNGYYALDFDDPNAAPGSGRPILAAAGGTVEFAGGNPSVGYGYYVKIDHGNGYKTLYGHLKEWPMVATNDVVAQGQQIGKLGSTGYSTGDHLHFQLTYDDDCLSTQPYSKPEPISEYSSILYGQSLTSDNIGPCSYVSQSSIPSTVVVGQQLSLWVKFKNEGIVTWSNNDDDDNYVELGSCNQSGTVGYSFFNYPCTLPNDGEVESWLSCFAPCTFSQGNGAPESEMTFSFDGKVREIDPGTYNVYFAPVFDGEVLPGWGQMQFEITVAELQPEPTSEFLELVGKFTDDSYSDVCVYEPGAGKLWVASNATTDDRFVPQVSSPWLSNFCQGSTYTPLSGDIGGSDLDDVCMLDRSLGRWFVAYSNGSQFTNIQGQGQGNYWLDNWGKSSVGTYTPLLGDFNNDGYLEPILYEAVSGNWYVALRDASLNKFNPSGSPWITGYGDGVGQYIPVTGNFVGDGKYDIGLYQKSTGNWYVAENVGGSFTRRGQWISGFGNNGTFQVFTGQIRGDIKTDIGLFEPATGNWFVAQSTGSAFTKLSGEEEYGAWITDYGDQDYRPLAGYFSWDGYLDIGLYEPCEGNWFIAINDGSPDRFTRTDGVYDYDSWMIGWGQETCGSPKMTAETNQAGEFLPKLLALHQNYPNPFNPVTTISYSLPSACQVKLTVYNVLGQQVAHLVDEFQAAGEHSVNWDSQVASGIYFYKLVAGEATETKKMVLLK